MKTKHAGVFDLSLFTTALVLWIVGIFVVYSATYINTSGPLAGLYKSQIMWVVMGIIVIVMAVSIPGKFFFNTSYIFYGASILLLLYAIVKGIDAKGAARWIAVGGMRMQPSEFAKIGLLLALARYLSQNEISLLNWRSLIFPAIIIGIPFLLVLKQPDLGTAMVFCILSVPMFFWAGMSLLEIFFLCSPVLSVVLSAIPLVVAYGAHQSGAGFAGTIPWGLFFISLVATLYYAKPPRFIFIAVIALNLVAATVTNVIWGTVLRDYQKMRVISFLNPEADAAGAGYQVIQSMVAIGSASVFGKGYLQGSQSRLSYLPEQHTDFIFSVFGEQFGLVGCTLILSVYLFLVIRALSTVQHIRNRFTNLVIVGGSTVLAFHAFINAAMVMGLMPVVGVPFPFLSYGGSFVLTVSILLGLILNARTSSQDF